MKSLGLSPAQIEQRRKFIGGSDAGRVMAGEWRSLWREKTGRAQPEDLQNILAVQMGSATEEFNAFWYTKQTGRDVMGRGKFLESGTYPFMAANLDGMTRTSKGHRAYIDFKHCGRLGEAEVLRYTPQCVHCATILGLDWWCLSVFVGNSKWELVEQEVDPIYQATLIAREREFWSFVERDEEPPEPDVPVLAPKPQPKLRSIIVPVEPDVVFDALVTQNNWLPEVLQHVKTFVNTHGAATVNAIEREAIKGIVPEDVGEVVFGRYRFSRTRAGAVTQSVKPLERDE